MQLLTTRWPMLTSPSPGSSPLPPRQLPPVYTLSMTSYGMEYPFGQLDSAVLAASLPSFLCTPCLLAGGAVRAVEESLT